MGVQLSIVQNCLLNVEADPKRIYENAEISGVGDNFGQREVHQICHDHQLLNEERYEGICGQEEEHEEHGAHVFLDSIEELGIEKGQATGQTHLKGGVGT